MRGGVITRARARITMSSDSSDPQLDDGDAFMAAVLQEFPPVCAAFAYGSAIFGQRGYSIAQRNDAMIDLVMVVDDAEQWHADNMAGGNADHYSGISYLGARAVANVQEMGGRIYYNQTSLHGRRIKYGVITRDALCDDLHAWSSLYVGGRLHKPVRLLTPWPVDVAPLVESNRRAALHASLLLLPARFDGGGLLSAICGLSYEGDVRMGIGESARKPFNIAAGQHAVLGEMYAPSIAALHAEGHTIKLADAGHVEGGGLDDALTAGWDVQGGLLFEQDFSLETRRTLLAALPAHTQRTMLGELAPAVGAAIPSSGGSSGAHAEAITASLDGAACALWRRAPSECQANRQIASALRASLRRIVFRSSLSQTFKGVATAGVATSVAYAVAKIRKRLGQDRQVFT